MLNFLNSDAVCNTYVLLGLQLSNNRVGFNKRVGLK